MKITLNEFRALPQNKKMDCLFENQMETMKLIKGYKFYQKCAAAIGSFILMGMGIIFKGYVSH